ncbi:hypothetical protein [Pseudomonas phage Bertil]|uniref:Uncharacterized protein n=1 Tax=Pseudomonas phage Bertil TaxID=2801385 RepID=A0A7T8EQD0_9CAUD|nr:hypothetical protein [Pseudomonas phage Bertil]QQO90877.1 hypothetical protein [Pseudomonas phage Strit]
MSRRYKVRLTDGSDETVEASDVQITAVGVKFLNGQGKAAVVVAYFNPSIVASVIEVKA